MYDSIVVLVALDLDNEGLIHGGLNKSKWKDLMIGAQLYDRNWLLSYEADVKGWLNSKKGTDYISKEKFFSYLRVYNIQFYDTNRKSTIYDLTDDDKEEPEEYVKLAY